jgi:spore maturation protein B
MIDIFIRFSTWILPLMIGLVILHGYLTKVDIFSCFVEGAAEAVTLVIKILPYIVGIYFAVELFQVTGALNWLLRPFQSILTATGTPAGILPLLIIRPMSGSAAMSLSLKLMEKYGPDSLTGLMAATIQGSTDTTMYITGVYFGSVGVKNPPYAVLVGLAADLAGFAASIFFCNLFFRG